MPEHSDGCVIWKGIDMSEYFAMDIESGEYTQVYDLEKCLKAIRIRNQDNERQIKSLLEENKQLREEYSKDAKIQEMQQKLDKMYEDYWRGFPITEEKQAAIEEWKKKHDEKIHGYTTDALRMKAECVSGGRYMYKFIPTSLGVSGVIRCHCGAEFEFQKIG